MWPVAGFWWKTEARSPGSVEAPVGFFAEGITTLNDKAGNDAVKGQAVIKLQSDQVQKILDVARRVIGEKPDFNISQFGGDNGFRIFFRELESCGIRHSERTLPRPCKVHQVKRAQNSEDSVDELFLNYLAGSRQAIGLANVPGGLLAALRDVWG